MLELHELTGQESMSKCRNLPVEGQIASATGRPFQEKYYENAVLAIEQSDKEFYRT